MKKYKLHYFSSINQYGFTLIELLIVISIIGILTTIITINFAGIRERARDTQRKSDITQIQTALELYRTDSGTYPLTEEFPRCDNPFTNGTNTYLKEIPCDPLGTKIDYGYRSDGDIYILGACLENKKDKDKRSTDSHNNPPLLCDSDKKYFIVENP